LFERFRNEVLEQAFDSVSSFLVRWHFDVSNPPSESQRPAYRFALTENGYLLIWFKVEGFDTLACEYEYSLPGRGRIAGVRTATSLREADRVWAESCFQTALNNFVSKFVEMDRRVTVAEPVLV
jgi:hypothetical protein